MRISNHPRKPIVLLSLLLSVVILACFPSLSNAVRSGSSTGATTGPFRSSPALQLTQQRQHDDVLKNRHNDKHNKNNNKSTFRQPTDDDHHPLSEKFRGGATTTTTKTLSTRSQALYGVLVLTSIEYVARKLLQSRNLRFPAMLAGCLFLFAVQLLAQLVKPGWGDCIFRSLSPAAALLAKWIGVFFVPGLVMLPLAPSVGSGFEVAKVFSVVLCGFVFSLSTVSFSVFFLRRLQGDAICINPYNVDNIEADKAAPPPPKPFSDALMKNLWMGTLVSLPLGILATRAGCDDNLTSRVRAVAMFLATVTGYVWGARLPPVVTKIFHPILVSAAVALATTGLVSYATGGGSALLEDTLRSYKVGSLLPTKAGAGDYLLYLLGPTVVSFSVSMYGRKRLLKENFLIVVWSMLVSSAGGLFATAAFVRAISLGGKAAASKIVRLSVLTRNVTTPLAIVITAILGGDMAIAASMAIATAIIGGTYGRAILSSMGIHDPVARGLAIGAAGQGLGVASLVKEPDAFPFAAMSLVLNAIAATVIVCIPPFRNALLNVVVGDITTATV